MSSGAVRQLQALEEMRRIATRLGPRAALAEDIARTVQNHWFSNGDREISDLDAMQIAERILALPEMEALRLQPVRYLSSDEGKSA